MLPSSFLTFIYSSFYKNKKQNNKFKKENQLIMFSYCDECPFSCCNSNGECTDLVNSCACPNSSSLFQCKYCCSYNRCLTETQKIFCPSFNETPNIEFWVFLLIFFSFLCIFCFLGIVYLKCCRKSKRIEITLDPIIHLELPNNFDYSQDNEKHQIKSEITIVKKNLPPLPRIVEENGIPLVDQGG